MLGQAEQTEVLPKIEVLPKTDVLPKIEVLPKTEVLPKIEVLLFYSSCGTSSPPSDRPCLVSY